MQSAVEAQIRADLQRLRVRTNGPLVVNPLTEGIPPADLDVGRFLSQLAENRARQQRLQAAQANVGRASERDRVQEAARLALGKALSDAVDCGYLDEQRALAIIVAGQLNDQPMAAEGARTQVRAALAQLRAAGTLTEPRLVAILEQLDATADPDPAAVSRPEAGPADDDDDDDDERELLR